jgi:hypothetical protein
MDWGPGAQNRDKGRLLSTWKLTFWKGVVEGGQYLNQPREYQLLKGNCFMASISNTKWGIRSRSGTVGPVHTTKACRRNIGIPILILSLGIKWM